MSCIELHSVHQAMEKPKHLLSGSKSRNWIF
uniref:Uncharacterized protein n=1 Tax=Anguilla anguilla TaxID=7936 RepID=A0A0E9Q489_ANGAN